MSYTKNIYENEVSKAFLKEFNETNAFSAPRITKVSLNSAIKSSDSDKNFNSYVKTHLSNIAGQNAVFTKAKKSIAGFKLREGSVVGCLVTLRGNKMYEFLDRLIYIAMPRIRDFRGLSLKGFNQSFAYSFGIKEHTIFSEINLDSVTKIFGMNITICSTARNKKEAEFLLKKLKFPIK